MDMTRIVTALLALVALVAAVILMVAGHNAQALVASVLFVGLVIACGPVVGATRRLP